MATRTLTPSPRAERAGVLPRVRCRPGDLALVTWGTCQGRLVRVIQHHVPGSVALGSEWPQDTVHPWIVESLGSALTALNLETKRKFDFGARLVLEDNKLRPLRKRRAKDETLAWTQVPLEGKALNPQKTRAGITADSFPDDVVATLEFQEALLIQVDKRAAELRRQVEEMRREGGRS